MFEHAPHGYACPMCDVASGVYSEHNAVSDIVLQSSEAFALVSRDPSFRPRPT